MGALNGVPELCGHMIDSAIAHKRAQDSLGGFPARVTEAYLAFAESGDGSQLDIVVFGILRFYLANKPAGELDAMPCETRLIEDLGCDSLTMMDSVFMIESLFDVKLDDTEMAQLTTLRALRQHLWNKLQRGAS